MSGLYVALAAPTLGALEGNKTYLWLSDGTTLTSSIGQTCRVSTP